jgi:hypothetical protein
MPEKCRKCLRNTTSSCGAMKKYDAECWAYTDDLGEYVRRESERLRHMAIYGLVPPRGVVNG